MSFAAELEGDVALDAHWSDVALVVLVRLVVVKVSAYVVDQLVAPANVVVVEEVPQDLEVLREEEVSMKRKFSRSTRGPRFVRIEDRAIGHEEVDLRAHGCRFSSCRPGRPDVAVTRDGRVEVVARHHVDSNGLLVREPPVVGPARNEWCRSWWRAGRELACRLLKCSRRFFSTVFPKVATNVRLGILQQRDVFAARSLPSHMRS